MTTVTNEMLIKIKQQLNNLGSMSLYDLLRLVTQEAFQYIIVNELYDENGYPWPDEFPTFYFDRWRRLLKIRTSMASTEKIIDIVFDAQISWIFTSDHIDYRLQYTCNNIVKEAITKQIGFLRVEKNGLGEKLKVAEKELRSVRLNARKAIRETLNGQDTEKLQEAEKSVLLIFGIQSGEELIKKAKTAYAKSLPKGDTRDIRTTVRKTNRS